MMRRNVFALAGGAALLAVYVLLVRPRLEVPAEKSVLEEYDGLPLKAHELLADVPLHSLACDSLPGGRKGMNILEIQQAAGMADMEKIEVGTASKLLFDARAAVGRMMGWDEVPELNREITYLSRVTEDERRRSLVPPGEVRGIGRVLYCFEREMLLEIINKTVHCFWAAALNETRTGYALYNAVYVKRLNWRTPIYMALISPVLNWIIYPAMGRSMRRSWRKSFPHRPDTLRA
jgi:hypothetical protein